MAPPLGKASQQCLKLPPELLIPEEFFSFNQFRTKCRLAIIIYFVSQTLKTGCPA